MTTIALEEALGCLDEERFAFVYELAGLGEGPQAPDPVGPLIQRIHALYQHRLRQLVREGLTSAEGLVRQKLAGEDDGGRMVERPAPPTWTELLGAAAKDLKVARHDVSHGTQLTYCAHEITLRALKSMSPEDRVAFFEAGAEAEDAAAEAGVGRGAMHGPMAAFAGIGLAQASGFAVYQAATTALAFGASALGITLPFAAYTGLTSFLAFVIGVPGITLAALYATLKVTGPKWKRLHPIVLALGSAMAERRPDLLEQSLS